MAEIPRSSFIPRQSNTAVPVTMQRRRTFHVFAFLATAILVCSLAGAGGVYFYKGVTQKKLDAAQKALDEEIKKIGTGKLDEVREFNRTLLSVNFLLNQHIAPSKLFEALQLKTMKGVQFTSFSLAYDPSFEVSLDVRGATGQFKTVALQALKFKEQPLLKDAVFSELDSSDVAVTSKNQDTQKTVHKVNFSVAGKIAQSDLLYDGKQIATEETVSETNNGVLNELASSTDAGVSGDSTNP